MREQLSQLAFLLEYPDESFHRRVQALAALGPAWPPAAAAPLAEFAQAAGAQDLDAWQELYTRTFDLAPLCVPYISVHALGAENKQRAKLMTGLLHVYRQPGFVSGQELPDHLALILKNAPRFSAEEWAELRAFCLDQALVKMGAALEQNANPYAPVVRGVQQLVAAAPAGAAPAMTLGGAI